MRYHNITKDDMLNGEGLRYVLWLSGCSHRCPGCQNPVTWDAEDGLLFDENAKAELFDGLGKDYISGVTLSGGDPLYPANREQVGELIREVTETFPEKTIWVYTGYLWEEIQELPFLRDVDVIIDGRYVAELADRNLHWCGSSNQRIIDVKASLRSGAVVLWEDDSILARLQRAERRAKQEGWIDAEILERDLGITENGPLSCGCDS